MSYLKESQLKGFRRSTQTFSSVINKSLRGFRDEPKALKKSIFLSHKHDELEALDGAISFLKREGAHIYVDWLDEGMPKVTNSITAVRIKEKIRNNDKFILLATEAAINSKWCNWELGLGDAAKYIDNIALLPVEKDGTRFSGAEYVQIYPFIEYQDGQGRYSNGKIIPVGYYVKFPMENGSRTLIKLSDWLRR